jgi:hypothetical protein
MCGSHGIRAVGQEEKRSHTRDLLLIFLMMFKDKYGSIFMIEVKAMAFT